MFSSPAAVVSRSRQSYSWPCPVAAGAEPVEIGSRVDVASGSTRTRTVLPPLNTFAAARGCRPVIEVFPIPLPDWDVWPGVGSYCGALDRAASSPVRVPVSQRYYGPPVVWSPRRERLAAAVALATGPGS